MKTIGSSTLKPLQAQGCSHCLGTGIRTSSDWENYWADRDRLYLAGFTDTEIDDELPTPDGPEISACRHSGGPAQTSRARR